MLLISPRPLMFGMLDSEFTAEEDGGDDAANAGFAPTEV